MVNWIAIVRGIRRDRGWIAIVRGLRRDRGWIAIVRGLRRGRSPPLALEPCRLALLGRPLAAVSHARPPRPAPRASLPAGGRPRANPRCPARPCAGRES